MNVGLAVIIALVLFFACLFIGGLLLLNGIPGLTQTWQTYSALQTDNAMYGDVPAISPDSSRVAFTVSAEYMHFPVGIARVPDGGIPLVTGGNVDLYILDLRTRDAPRRIFSTNATNVETSGCAWTSEGIYLRYVDRKGSHYFLVSPKGHSSRSIKKAAGEKKYVHSNQDASVAHVEWDADELFYWHPETYTKEFLYSLPASYRGHPISGAQSIARFRLEERYQDSMHRIQSINGVITHDTLYSDVHTYVPRPGVTSRQYNIDYSFDADAEGSDDHAENLTKGVVRTVRTLGPAGESIHDRIPMRLLHGVGRSGGLLWVTVTKQPEPSDSIAARGIVVNGNSSAGPAGPLSSARP